MSSSNRSDQAINKDSPADEDRSTNSDVFETLSAALSFSTEEQSKWWFDSGSVLARLLEVAQYSVHHQYRVLLFFHRYTLPFLGPYPPVFKTVLTKPGIPICFSLNFQEPGSPVIRQNLEVLNTESGTAVDPFNRKPTEQLLVQLSPGLPDFDSALLDYFTKELFLSDEEVSKISNPENFPIRTHGGIGIDYKGDKVIIKHYVHPRWKSLATGIPVRHLLRHSIEPKVDEMKCDEAFNTVHEFLEERVLYDLHTFLSWDARPIHDSRLKLYGLTNDVDFDEITDLWTMGGRLNDETAKEGLNHLKHLWDLLKLSQKQRHYTGATEHEPLNFGAQDELLPMFWNYQINSGKERPSPKIYIPLFGENDLRIASAIAEFFAYLGWEEKAKTYIDTVKAIHPKQDISQTTGLQSILSFAYSKEKGVYMSIYYHSTISYPAISGQT